RPARPRPRHPDVGGAAVVGLPAVAVGALGVLVLRGLLARVPQGRLPARAARLRGPTPPLRHLTRYSSGSVGESSAVSPADSSAALSVALSVADSSDCALAGSGVTAIEGRPRAKGTRCRSGVDAMGTVPRRTPKSPWEVSTGWVTNGTGTSDT